MKIQNGWDKLLLLLSGLFVSFFRFCSFWFFLLMGCGLFEVLARTPEENMPSKSAFWNRFLRNMK